jgi:hypothetical protein
MVPAARASKTSNAAPSKKAAAQTSGTAPSKKGASKAAGRTPAPDTPAAPDALPVVPDVVGAAATGGNCQFNFVFNGVTYTVQVYVPDTNGQYGFAVTQAGNPIAALTYKDDQNWSISVGLPPNLQIDTNLMVKNLNINIEHGAVVPLH